MDTLPLTGYTIQQLNSITGSACISLYLPVRCKPGSPEYDISTLKTLISEAENLLTSRLYTPEEIRVRTMPLYALAFTEGFDRYGYSTLAIFSNEGDFQVVGMHTETPEIIKVDYRFYTAPLRHSLQSMERFRLVARNFYPQDLFA